MATRILAVDDDKLIRMNLRLALGRAGFDVDTACTCAEAKNFLASHHYSVVITDLDLPDANGLEILACVREVAAVTKVLILTGSATSISSEEALSVGACGLILKPFALGDLVEAIREAVDPPLASTPVKPPVRTISRKATGPERPS